MSTTTEKEVTVADGLGDATAAQVLVGATFTSESGFNQEGTYDPAATNTASNITYDNTTSEAEATNVQDVIDDIIDGTTTVKKAASADSATKATQDGNGKSIPDTYATKTELNDLEIGGRNLYLGTKDFSGNKWDSINKYEDDGTYLGFSVKKISAAWSGLTQPINVEVGEVYTLSAYIKKDAGKVNLYTNGYTTEITGNTNPQTASFNTTTEWEKYTVTFKVIQTGQIRPRFENPDATQTMWICGIKLERGNKATDWTPAPEDTVPSAETANKLSTARNIGKASFDGTKNITLEDIMGIAGAKSSATGNSGKYTKIARIDVSSGNYVGCSGAFLVIQAETNSFQGILQFFVRSQSSISNVTVNLRWSEITNNTFEETVFAVKVSDGIYDLYYKALSNYVSTIFTLITSKNPQFITLYSGQEYVDSIEPVATSTLQSVASRAVSADSVPSTGQASVDGNRKVWFSNIQAGIENEQRAYDTDFTYNAWTKTLKVKNVDGTANKAVCDGAGAVIAQHYAKKELGAWTPSVQGCTLDSSADCIYEKIDKMVFIQAYIKVKESSSVTIIEGLPYPVEISGSANYGSSQPLPVKVFVNGSEHNANYYGTDTAVSRLVVPTSLATGSTIIIHGYYFTTA